MKVKAKRGLIYKGTVYKAGEVFDVDEAVGYAFTWLTKKNLVEFMDAQPVKNLVQPVKAQPATPEPDDDLVVSGAELPPLNEAEPVPKKGRKNV